VNKNLYKNFLLKLPRFLKRLIVICSDFFICFFSVSLAFKLRLDEWGMFEGNHLFVFLTSLVFSFPLFIFFGLYQSVFRYAGSMVIIAISKAFIFYTVVFIFIFVVIAVDGIPWSIGVIQPILFFIGIIASRYIARLFLGVENYRLQKKDQVVPMALIYGAGVVGRNLAIFLMNNSDIKVKAFVDDNPNLHGSFIYGIKVFGFSSLDNIISTFSITDILLAIPSISQTRRNEIISSLYGRGARIRSVPKLNDLIFGNSSMLDLRDLDTTDLLGRDAILPDVELLEKNIRNKVVLITGAGGSIGSELCRQVMKFTPKSLVLIDVSEYALYSIYEELKRTIAESCDKTLSPHVPIIDLVPCLASVRDKILLQNIFRKYKPYMVIHAAAYKHVPLVEKNITEGISNNVFGTLKCAEVSMECGVTNFILVSSDKAVRPTNVMGASKRISELVVQSLSNFCTTRNYRTIFSIVRFGNVLDSSGSVTQIFRSQIAAGGPITLTHPEVNRFFMTIPEASQLVIQAGAIADGGEVFVLDMGKPVRIYDLAIAMINISGLLVKDNDHPHGDIEILVTGLRPGEKLYEELLIGANPQPTTHPKIIKAHEDFLTWDVIQKELELLNLAIIDFDYKAIQGMLKKLVDGYQPDVNSF
jgi:FlaA1/EpsC-like NDP-sugar epimerase